MQQVDFDKIVEDFSQKFKTVFRESANAAAAIKSALTECNKQVAQALSNDTETNLTCMGIVLKMPLEKILLLDYLLDLSKSDHFLRDF